MTVGRRLGPYLAITDIQLWVVAFVTGSLGCLGIFLAIQRGAVEVGLSLAVFVMTLLFSLFAIDSPRRGWIHPIVALILIFIVHVGIRPVLGYGLGLPQHVAVPWASSGDLDRAMAQQLLLHACACMSMVLGYAALAPAGRLSAILPDRVPLSIFASGIITAISIIALLIAGSGGLLRFIQNLFTSSSIRDYGMDTGVAQSLSVLISIGVVAGMASQFQPSRIVALIGALAGAACAFSMAGRRSTVIFTLIGMVAARSIFTQKLRLLPLAMIVIFGVVLLGIVGVARASLYGGDEISLENSGELWNSSTLERVVSESGERVNEESAQIALHAIVPERMDHLWGASYATMMFAPIPRAFFHDKPRGTDYLAGKLLFGADWGIPVGSVAEAWWNFGLLGVIVIFVCYGILIALLCIWYERNLNEWTAIVLIITVAITLQPATNAVIPFTQFLVMLSCLRLLQLLFSKIHR